MEHKTDDSGAVWNGERAIINHINADGFDPRLGHVDNFGFDDDQIVKLKKICQGLQLYKFSNYPLHDAAIWPSLLVKITINSLQLSDGIIDLQEVFQLADEKLTLQLLHL